MLVWAIAPFAFAGYTVALPLWATATLGWHEQDLGAFFIVLGIVVADGAGRRVSRAAASLGRPRGC